eukprot:symbB.v1.2.014769.t1/scaffold1084.1/size139254/8
MPVPSGFATSKAFQEVIDQVLQQHVHELCEVNGRMQELEHELRLLRSEKVAEGAIVPVAVASPTNNSGSMLDLSMANNAVRKVRSDVSAAPSQSFGCLETRRVRNRRLEASQILEQLNDNHLSVETFFQQRDDTVSQFEKSLESKVLSLTDETSGYIDLEYDEMSNYEKFQAWLQSHRFDFVITILLCLNVIWMAAELQITGSFSGYLLGVQDSSMVSIDQRKAVSRFFQNGDYVFTAFFTLDVLVRIIVLKWKFWKVCMNYVDALVTVAAIVEILLVTTMNSAFLFRLLRIGKLARALRLVTMSNTLASLELLTKCLIASVDMLFWTFCLLACVQCVAGMLISGLVRDFIENESNDKTYREEVYRYYGTFSRTFLSMFEILFANWGPPCRVLVENVNEWFSLFFLLYRCVVGFALLNVVNAVFVQQTMKTASSDEELAFKQKERDIALYTRKVRKLFQSMDDSGDGALNLQEFAKLANSPKLKFWMSQLELEYHDLLSLFEFLDNGDGQITLSEFIDGAARLRGSAKAIDVWRLETKVEPLAYKHGLRVRNPSGWLKKMVADGSYQKLIGAPEPPGAIRSFLIVVSSIIVCLTTSGLAFGFSALVPPLLKVGAFHQRCDSNSHVCQEQLSCLTGMFAMTTSLLNIAALPSGCAVFAKGPTNDVAYMVGFLLLGVSGPCIFNCTLSFGNLFPRHAGLITAALVGTFDASSAVFVALAAALDSGAAFSTTFQVYAIIPALQSICSGAEFWMLAYTVSVTMLCINFFIATAFPQMLHVTGSVEVAKDLNSQFAAFLPAGGIVYIPLIGIIIDRLGTTVGYFILQAAYGLFTLLMMAFFSGAGDIFATAAFGCFAFCRPFFYSLTPAFCGRRFGFTHFGTIFGLLFAISGFCNFGVQVLTTLASHYGFHLVNVLLGCLQLSTSALPFGILATNQSRREMVQQKGPDLDDALLRSFSIRSFSMRA